MGDKSKGKNIVHEYEHNTGIKLTLVPLNGLNYVSWSRTASLALGGRSKLDYINGKKEIPKITDPNFDDRQTNDQLVMSWILNSMEPAIAEIFTQSENAKELWAAIKENYGHQDNFARIFQLKQEISKVRSQVILSSELPSLSNVCATLMREETQKKIMSVETKYEPEGSEKSAFVSTKPNFKHIKRARNNVSGKGKYDGNSVRENSQANRHSLRCNHCGKTNHTIDRCWQKYPHLRPSHNRKGGTSSAQTADTQITIEKFAQLLQQFAKNGSSSTQDATRDTGSGHREDDW
ncbi:uncharacterized protein LOC143846625 [Tasmannia lanceolata]|uniref:uncharacterized protein LOC143846625 n=1 Tax=Tasmannia lanceolata TaxID=3420 RepID=UPI004063316D